MTESVKNRGFTLHFCTYSKDLSEECVEVRGHPCCALYSEKDQHSLHQTHIGWPFGTFPVNGELSRSSFWPFFSLAPNFLPFLLLLSLLLLFSLYVCLFSEFLPRKVILFMQFGKREWRSSSRRRCSIPAQPSLPFYSYCRVFMDLLFCHQFAAFASRWARLLLLPGGLADVFPNPPLIWLHWFLSHV